MGEHLKKRLAQSRFEGPYQEALLNVMVAGSHLRDQAQAALQDHGVTLTQYNVLRILKGVHPEGYPRCEIARRMIDRAPDLTRLVDRMAKAGLVERTGSDVDRRHSVTRITRRGLDLIERLKPVLAKVNGAMAQRLSKTEAEELSRLLENLYGEM